MLRKTTITVTGTGGTTYSGPVNGLVEYILVDFTNGNAATGSVVITDEEKGVAVLTLSATATDFSQPVRRQAYDNSGSAITGEYSKIPVSSRFKLVVSGEDANSEVAVTLWWSE